ncbi:hypothetical protein [Acinetobacter wuhouensis]|uniref:DUF4303 domain-containing protein n=1 Tax=Acinetobacter wuhouensis TaxID=1879050 RepID=A0A4Q7AKL1_9GAMM|nr:hypothetical protein [Acinetobacter wuhouensis]RZG47497.1 hypothetical protein EXU28_06105 [Acinetobacter wuhouensis]
MSNQLLEQEQQIKTNIIDAFQAFYYRYKKQNIYAFVVEVDESFIIQSFLISTETSIFDETENKYQYLLEKDKWSFNQWKYRQKSNSPHQFSSTSAHAVEIHPDQLITHLFEHVFPDQVHLTQLDSLISIYQQAISFITKIYNLDLSRILFLIHSPIQKNIILDTAQQLNPSSSLLFEFMAHIRISKENPAIKSIKLRQIDKDELINLAQLVNLFEPYDSLSVAHQAYLLTLEPKFSDLHTHIQDLVKNIAAMNDPTLALDKAEILDRINYFYTV